MALSIKCDALNVEFQDNYIDVRPNLVSGDEIKTIAAKIHRRFEDMGNAAYKGIAQSITQNDTDLVDSSTVYPVQEAVRSIEKNGFTNLLYMYNTTVEQDSDNNYVVDTPISDIPAGDYNLYSTTGNTGKLASITFYNSSGNSVGSAQMIATDGSPNNITLTGTATRMLISDSGSYDSPLNRMWITGRTTLNTANTPYYGTAKSTFDSLQYLIDNGCKNYIDYTSLFGGTIGMDNRTFVNNYDGTFTATLSQTITSLQGTTLGENLNIYCPEDMILVGCPYGGSSTKYNLSAVYTNNANAIDYGTGAIVPSGRTIAKLKFSFGKDATVGTYTFRPMLIPLRLWRTANSFVKHNDSISDIKSKYMVDLVDRGYKNIIDLSWQQYKQTINGVEWTVDPETGTVSATRVSSSSQNSSIYVLYGSNPNQVNMSITENFVATGCTGGSDSTYRMQVAWKSSPSGATLLLNFADGELSLNPGVIRYVCCTVISGYQANNVVFRPMVCPRRYYSLSQTFEPYCAKPSEVYQDVCDHDTALINLIDTGNKNLCKFNRAPGVYGPSDTGGQTFTINNDNSITLSGTASTTYYAFRIVGDPSSTGWSYGMPIPKGRYILTGLGSDASSTTYRYILGIATSSGANRTSTSIYEDYEFEVTNDTTRIDLAVYVAYQNSATPTVYPMICSKSAYDISNKYVPYQASNAELSAATVPITKTLITDSTAQALTNCVISGDVSSVAGKTSGYVVIRTTVLDFNSAHVMQVAEFSDGTRSTRIYNGSWQSWV